MTDLRDFFLRQKKAIRSRTREIFPLFRPEDGSWRAATSALSIHEILRHMWVSERGVRRVALEGNFSYYNARIPGGLKAVLGTPGSIAEEIAEMERVHEETLEAVEAIPSEAFEEERTDAALGFRRKVAVILYGMNEHEVHHRAQLMVYLRILGRPAPEPFKKAPTRLPAV